MRILFPPEIILTIPNNKMSTIPRELEALPDVREVNPSFRGRKANGHKLCFRGLNCSLPFRRSADLCNLGEENVAPKDLNIRVNKEKLSVYMLSIHY